MQVLEAHKARYGTMLLPVRSQVVKDAFLAAGQPRAGDHRASAGGGCSEAEDTGGSADEGGPEGAASGAGQPVVAAAADGGAIGGQGRPLTLPDAAVPAAGAAFPAVGAAVSGSGGDSRRGQVEVDSDAEAEVQLCWA